MAGRWIPLAEVARPHGVWGEVRLKVYNSDSDLLFSQTEVLVQAPERKDVMMQVESVRGADTGYLLAKFRGVDGRDAADHLRGAAVCVERERFPELDEGEFYVCDVIGARLVGPRGGSSNGHPLGEVADFVSYPSADVLIIKLGAAPSTTIELPLVDDFVERVDTASGEVVLRAEGLEWIEAASAGSKRHAD